MRTTPSARPSCTLRRPTSSLTRRPLAYISSSMARSRRPRGIEVSGAASSASTCASDKVLGTRSGWRAGSRRRVGSAAAGARAAPSGRSAGTPRAAGWRCWPGCRRGAPPRSRAARFRRHPPACNALRGQPLRQRLQVAAVGRQCQRGQAVLEPERVDETLDQRRARLGSRDGVAGFTPTALSSPTGHDLALAREQHSHLNRPARQAGRSSSPCRPAGRR
jgi:hypothetical protein